MKLKKKHFARLKEIAKETNENGVFGMTGIRLNTLITDIESVQKTKEEFSFTDINQLQKEFSNIKTVQEKPLSATGFVGNVEFTGNIFNDSIKQEFAKSYMRQGKAMVAASTDDSTEFKGGLRDAVESGPTPKDISDFLDKALVLSNKEPKIGDVGYFNLGNPNSPIVYGRMRNYTGNKFQDTHGNWYIGFSKTPPELK